MSSPVQVQIAGLQQRTGCTGTCSKRTTRPPLSPVARCRPSASNSTAEIMSAAPDPTHPISERLGTQLGKEPHTAVTSAWYPQVPQNPMFQLKQLFTMQTKRPVVKQPCLCSHQTMMQAVSA